jgi:hypothetical protein
MSDDKSVGRQPRWLLLSLIVHLVLITAYGVPEIMRRLAERARMEQARLDALARAEADRLAKEAAELAAKQERRDETKQEIIAQLAKEFSAIVGEAADEATLEASWSDLLSAMDLELSSYADALGDVTLSDAQLDRAFSHLKQQMVGKWQERLLAQTMAEEFLGRVGDQVVPQVAEHMRGELARRVDEPLKQEGDKIVADEKSFIDQQRQAIVNDLDRAGKAADEAARQAAAAKSGDSAASAANAASAIASADVNFKSAIFRAAAFSDELKTAIAGPADAAVATATKEVADVVSAAARADAQDTNRQSDEAAAASKALAATAQSAKDSAEKAAFDAAALARAVVSKVQDSEIRSAVNSAFEQGFANEALPRLSGKLTDQFQKDLSAAGISDQRLVGEVNKAVSALLHHGVPKAVTGESGRAAPDDNSATADNERNSAAQAQRDSQRNKALGDKARSASGKASGEARNIGKDASADEALVAAASGGARGPASGGKRGIADQLAALSQRGGRDQFLDPSASSANISKMRQSATSRGKGRGNHGRAAKFHGAEHAKLTAGIHDRDAEAAHGSDWNTAGAEGETSQAEASESIIKAATVLLPPEKKDPVAGKAADAEPYKPAFKTINFAAVSYALKPITIDGDLSEWTDIHALELQKNGSAPPGMTAAEKQTVKVAWDHSGFYLAYDIADVDKSIAKANADEFWNADGVEIFFDAPNSKDRLRGSAWTQQLWVWPFGSQADEAKTGGEAVKDDPTRGWTMRTYTAKELQRAAVKTEAGWRMEVHVPEKLVHKLELKAGRILGFNLSVSTGTTLDYYWAGSADVTTSERPDTWGDMLLAGSDGKLEAPEKFTRDVKASEAAKTVRGLIIGQPLRLRVTDADMNLAADKPDKLSLSVKSSDDYELVVLEETEPASGIFEGAISTALSLGEAVDKSLSLYEGETVDVTYVDQARADGSRKVEVRLLIDCSANASDLADAR